MGSVGRAKHYMRRTYRQIRQTLDARVERSLAICHRVCAIPAYTSAHCIHCYMSIESEVDTTPLITHALAEHKQVVVPIVRGKNLVHSVLTSLARENLVYDTWGIPHPRQVRLVQACTWDVIIVPVLAFDRTGYRLGYGKGFYDRMLASCGGSSIPSIGVAFAAQEVAAVPHNAYDVPLDWIVTEDEIICSV